MSLLALQPCPRPAAFRPARQPVRRAVLCRAESAGSEDRAPEAPAQQAPADACKTCGCPKADIPWGCQQDGRVMGGIGSVPGFGWWPIKAYRECPQASKRGIAYRRKGQITDEVLFGRSGPQ